MNTLIANLEEFLGQSARLGQALSGVPVFHTRGLTAVAIWLSSILCEQDGTVADKKKAAEALGMCIRSFRGAINEINPKTARIQMDVRNLLLHATLFVKSEDVEDLARLVGTLESVDLLALMGGVTTQAEQFADLLSDVLPAGRLLPVPIRPEYVLNALLNYYRIKLPNIYMIDGLSARATSANRELSRANAEISRANDLLEELKEEIQHWKGIADARSPTSHTVSECDELKETLARTEQEFSELAIRYSTQHSQLKDSIDRCARLESELKQKTDDLKEITRLNQESQIRRPIPEKSHDWTLSSAKIALQHLEEISMLNRELAIVEKRHHYARVDVRSHEANAIRAGSQEISLEAEIKELKHPERAEGIRLETERTLKWRDDMVLGPLEETNRKAEEHSKAVCAKRKADARAAEHRLASFRERMAGIGALLPRTDMNGNTLSSKATQTERRKRKSSGGDSKENEADGVSPSKQIRGGGSATTVPVSVTDKKDDKKDEKPAVPWKPVNVLSLVPIDRRSEIDVEVLPEENEVANDEEDDQADPDNAKSGPTIIQGTDADLDNRVCRAADDDFLHGQQPRREKRS